jgi:streptogramin lyase
VNFDLVVEDLGEGAYRARVTNSTDGDTPSTRFALPFDQRDLQLLLLQLDPGRSGTRRAAGSQYSQAAKDFGGSLFESTFSGDVMLAWRQSLQSARTSGRSVRLRLRLGDAPSVAGLPWELLYDRRTDSFIAQSEKTPVVRYMDTGVPPRAMAVSGPLRILAVISSPHDLPELDVDREWRRLQDALHERIDEGTVTLDRLQQPTLSALGRWLRNEEAHILHFIGHADFDPQIGDGVVFFCDEYGRRAAVTPATLGPYLQDHDPLRLVLLNACQTGRGDTSDSFDGMAQGLIQKQLDVVVAMQFPISDRAAATFTEEFYGALADGLPVDQAATSARKAMMQNHSEEWATPVLFMRSSDGDVFRGIRPVQRRMPSGPSLQQRETPQRLASEPTPSQPAKPSAVPEGSTSNQQAHDLDIVTPPGPVAPQERHLISGTPQATEEPSDHETLRTATEPKWEAGSALPNPPTAEPRRASVERDGSAPPQTRNTPLSRGRRPSAAFSRRLILTALILVVALAGSFLFLKNSGDTGPSPTPAQPPSAVVTPTPGAPGYSETRTIKTAPTPVDVKIDGSSLLISTESGHLQRVEAATGNQTSSFDFGSKAETGLVVNAGDVAVPLSDSTAIGFVDSSLAKQSQTLPTAPGHCRNGIAAPDGLWFACQTKTAGFLLHLTQRKEATGGRLTMPSHPFGLVANGDFLYVTFCDQDSVGKYNVKTNKMITAHIPGYPVSAALVNGNLWVTVSKNDEIAVLDPDTLAEKRRYRVGDEPWKIAVGLGSVWITNKSSSAPNQVGTLSRLDPETGQRQQDDIRVGVKPDELAVGPDTIYVANVGDNSISVIKSS